MSNSVSITEVMMGPVKLTEILLEDLILPAELSLTGLANAIGAPLRRMSEGFFLNLQNRDELRIRRAKMGKALTLTNQRAA